MKAERPANSGIVTLIGLVVIAAVLYFAKVVFIPVALSVLLTFFLAPVVIRLQRWRLPKPVAILITVFLAFSVIGFVGWLVTVQVIALAEKLPRYEQTLHAKVKALNGAGKEPGAFSRAGQLVESLKKDLEHGGTNSVSNGARAEHEPAVITPVPVPVEIKASKPNVIQTVQGLAGPFLGPLGTAGIVVIFVIAMLFQREDLRDRLIRLVSAGQLNKATEAIDDAARRISRYLFMQLVVNATYGLPIGVGLYYIGVPNAILWGLLATLLRFIPFLGPWIAAAFPVALAFAVDPGWSMIFLTIGLFLVVELISNNLVEPLLYSASTGTSNVALMVAALFWAWLWGPVGLFLSTPLTVCLVVMGKYVPGMNFFSVLLGSAPALEPHARLYHRMLAMDHDEMLSLAREYLKTHELIEFYDQVMIPALNSAEEDRHNGSLAEVRQQFILQNARELIDELEEWMREKQELPLQIPGPARILVVPAKDDIDEVAAVILIQLLTQAGIAAKLVPATSLPSECAEVARREHIEAVCISAVPPAALTSARHLCRRICDECGGVKSIVGVWSPKAEVPQLHRRLAGVSPFLIVTSMHEAVRQMKELVAQSLSQPMIAPPVPTNESSRLLEINRLRLLEGSTDEMFDTVSRELARAFEVPISLVSIVDADRQFWKAHVGLPADLAAAREAPRNTSICGHVVAANEPLVVGDVARDKRFANNPFVTSRGIRFYAGVPLRSFNGHAVGSLCVIDTKPRVINERDILMLQMTADRLMEAVQRREVEAA